MDRELKPSIRENRGTHVAAPNAIFGSDHDCHSDVLEVQEGIESAKQSINLATSIDAKLDLFVREFFYPNDAVLQFTVLIARTTSSKC